MLDVFSAGQTLAQRVLARRGTNTTTIGAAAPGATRVLFENRSGRGRRILNLWPLLAQCNTLPGFVCGARTFGTGQLADDVLAVRDVDVFVGMHGAGLSHAFFMRHGAALVEVRPFGFEGAWPDRYFRDALQRAGDPVLHVLVSMGAPELCTPRWSLDTLPLNARDGACALPWETLERALGHVRWLRQRPARYAAATPAARTLLAYPTASTPGVGPNAGAFVRAGLMRATRESSRRRGELRY